MKIPLAIHKESNGSGMLDQSRVEIERSFRSQPEEMPHPEKAALQIRAPVHSGLSVVCSFVFSVLFAFRALLLYSLVRASQRIIGYAQAKFGWIGNSPFQKVFGHRFVHGQEFATGRKHAIQNSLEKCVKG